MFKAAELIRSEAERIELHEAISDIVDADDHSVIVMFCPFGESEVRDLRFISRDDGNDVAVRLYRLFRDVPEEKRAAVAKAIAVCNRKFRFFKFVMKEDGEVYAAYDFPEGVPDRAVGETAMRLFRRLIGILDKAYPILLCALRE